MLKRGSFERAESLPETTSIKDIGLVRRNTEQQQKMLTIADSKDEVSSHGDLDSLHSGNAFTLQQKRNQLFDGRNWKRPVEAIP